VSLNCRLVEREEPLLTVTGTTHSIDEFVYQYTSFALWRNKVAGKTEEEKAILAESGQVSCTLLYLCFFHLADSLSYQVWSCYSVLNVLYSLIQKSKIQDQLQAAQKGEDVE